MGELVVELELMSRGWLVGNFNATTTNSVGWDIFAVRAARSLKIRVKAKRPGTDCFRWSAKSDGTVLAGLDPEDPCDIVAAVTFHAEGGYDVYLVPSAIVERELSANHAGYLAEPKRDGTPRRDSSQRNLYIDDKTEGGHGYAVTWATWLNAWTGLGQ